jgi:hypothetical protein
MCIVIIGNNEPEKNKMVHLPVKIDNEPYNALFYLNKYNLDNPPSKLQDNYFTQAIWHYKSYNYNLRDPTVIVIPIPIPKRSELEFGLIDINTNKIHTVFNTINNFKPSSETNLNTYDNNFYKMSIFRSKEELLTRIDWNVFNKPYDFDLRVNTLFDNNLYFPEYDWIYIVLIAETDILNNGFGIVYKSLDVDYFPIAREIRESTKLNRGVNYDLELYHFSNTDGSKSTIGPLGTKAYTTLVNKTDMETLNYLNGIPIIFEKNIVKRLTIDNIKHCNYYNIKGKGKNKNIYLMKNI